MDDDELVATLDDDLEEDAQPDEITNELDRLDPQSEFVTLKCGIEAKILPLRTRQLFAMLKIITHGAGSALQNAGLDFKEEPAVFLQKLISVVIFSIPDAANETIEFLQSMVEPAGLVDKLPRDLSKQERETNIKLWTDLNVELYNPDPCDTLDLVERIVHRESADIQALGKRIRGFLELASKTGQLSGESAASAPQAANSSETSPASSTSSRPSTAGRTNTSSTSRSNGSVKSPAPSRRGAGKKNGAAAS